MTAPADAEAAVAVREPPTAAPTIGTVRPRLRVVVDPGVRHRRGALLADAGSTASHLFAGASLVGASHEANGSPRQDSFAVSSGAGGRLVVAVADGLGSRASSQVGAETFCQLVLAFDATDQGRTAEDLLTAAAERTAQILQESWALSPRDISFVGLVMTTGTDLLQIARVGDASAFVLEVSGEFSEVFTAPEGPLNTVDASLPGAEHDDVEVTTVAPSSTVLLATDGLALDVRMSAGVRSWLAGCWQEPVGALAMADALRYERQGSLDDRTAAVVWPRSRSDRDVAATVARDVEDARTQDAGDQNPAGFEAASSDQRVEGAEDLVARETVARDEIGGADAPDGRRSSQVEDVPAPHDGRVTCSEAGSVPRCDDGEVREEVQQSPPSRRRRWF